MAKSARQKGYKPIFVYGTLKPGGRLACNWEATNLINHTKEALIYGSMFDTHYGFPAAVLQAHEKVCGVISGVLLYPTNTKHLKKILDRFDIVEGVTTGLYTREETVTLDGDKCYVYCWGNPKTVDEEYEPIPSGKWSIKTDFT